MIKRGDKVRILEVPGIIEAKDVAFFFPNNVFEVERAARVPGDDLILDIGIKGTNYGFTQDDVELVKE